eukprot:8447704-Alexandrium_andersonii.AAC.1
MRQRNAPVRDASFTSVEDRFAAVPLGSSLRRRVFGIAGGRHPSRGSGRREQCWLRGRHRTLHGAHFRAGSCTG